MDVSVNPHIPESDISGRWTRNTVLTMLL